MNIAFCEIGAEQEEYFKKHLKGHHLFFSRQPLTYEQVHLLKNVEILSTFIYSYIDKKMIESMPHLKAVITRSSGYDHIDLEICKKRGIVVCNVPAYSSNTVAEHAFALILTLARGLDKAIEKTKHDDFSLDGLRPFELKGKTLGVIGPGRIGQEMIKRALAFDMNVIAYGLHNSADRADELGVPLVSSLSKVLSESDIVTLHVPHTEKTHHLINMKTIKSFKRGSYLINTSRGELVDTDALLYGLKKGILAGAALDVLEGESELKDAYHPLSNHIRNHHWSLLRKNHALLKNHRVIITPHYAFLSKEATERVLESVLKTISSVKQDNPINRVA